MAGLRNRVAATASVLAFSVMLGGCQMLGIGGHRSANSDAAIERAEPGDLGAAQLAEGRRLLKEGRTVDAIESFMLAKAFPAHMPAAYNGLAVAYSRLGRTDLTERFFLTAAALAPEDDRYRTNLALFYARHPATRGDDPRLQVAALQNSAALEFAPVAPVEQALADVGPVVNPVRAMRAGVVVASNTARLRRVSSREVTVGGTGDVARVAAVAGPLPVVSYRQPRKAVVEVGGKAPEPAAKVALADKPEKASAYPIRIELEKK